MSSSADPLLDRAAQLAAELRERCAAGELGDGAEELLIGGYAAALALEGARRRLREQALALSERELGLAAQERELRALLRTLRGRLAAGGVGSGGAGEDGASVPSSPMRAARDAAGDADAHASGDQPAPQRLH